MHPVTHGKTKNRFCGPAAISIITGIDTGTAAALLRHKTGRRQITHTHTWEVSKALSALGFHLRPFYLQPAAKSRPTLAGWLKSSVEDRTAGRLFLVAAGNHWQVVSGRRYCCGLTGEIVSIRDERVKRRARVSEVYEITRVDASINPKRKVAELLAPTVRARVASVDGRKVKRLAERHGIELEFDGFTVGDGVWVFGPAWADDDVQEAEDPYLGERYCTDWDDVLERVEGYIAFMAERPEYFARGERLAA